MRNSSRIPDTDKRQNGIYAEGLSVHRGSRTVIHSIDVHIPTFSYGMCEEHEGHEEHKGHKKHKKGRETQVGKKGHITGIVGPNASGKTSLLRALAGALPASGSVQLHGHDLSSLSRSQIAQHIALAGQDASDSTLTVRDFVMLGRLPWQGRFAVRKRSDQDIVAEALAAVSVGHLADMSLQRLSGGERQRVHVARAFAQEAEFLLLDEPTNHLDVRFQHELMLLLRYSPLSSVVVLHDLNLAAMYCDRILLLNQGRIVADGSPVDVLTPRLLEPIYNIGIQSISSTTPAGEPCVQFLYKPYKSHTPHIDCCCS